MDKLFSAFLLLVPAALAQAAQIYVAPNGDDMNPGTKTRPLASIQAAVGKLQPGDLCLIREGVYRETVTFSRSGTAQKPITVQSYRGEKVVISGCDPVTGWTLQNAEKNL